MQGSLYERIITEVVKQSETTFEEEGVTRQTLEDLRKVRPVLFPPTYKWPPWKRSSVFP